MPSRFIIRKDVSCWKIFLKRGAKIHAHVPDFCGFNRCFVCENRDCISALILFNNKKALHPESFLCSLMFFIRFIFVHFSVNIDEHIVD